MLIDWRHSDPRMGTAMLALCTAAFDQLDLVVAG
jgi:hypothetical protein